MTRLLGDPANRIRTVRKVLRGLAQAQADGTAAICQHCKRPFRPALADRALGATYCCVTCFESDQQKPPSTKGTP
jgi:hypothetical protein